VDCLSGLTCSTCTAPCKCTFSPYHRSLPWPPVRCLVGMALFGAIENVTPWGICGLTEQGRRLWDVLALVAGLRVLSPCKQPARPFCSQVWFPMYYWLLYQVVYKPLFSALSCSTFVGINQRMKFFTSFFLRHVDLSGSYLKFFLHFSSSKGLPAICSF
jgi:hypothetical protein